MFGQGSKKELCYENLKITKNAWDSNIIQTNGKYLSVNWDASGGGAFAIIPLEEMGKAPDTVSLFRGHKGPVLDTAFDPFDTRTVASCSDDGNILIWKIPDNYSFHNYRDENDNVIDVVKPERILKGHSRKVGHIAFHPCAKDVLASSSIDCSVKFWNVQTGTPEFTLQHPDLVTSFAFNHNGQLLATTSRDKKLRIWDLSSRSIISECQGHSGAKPSRVVWLGDSDRILTTGFSRLSDRQVGIWDVNNTGKGPIDGFLVVDSSSGVLIPIFDESTSILYLAGKGDGNIRYFEYDSDNLFELSQYSSTDAQRGFAAVPKMYVNMRENEILKSFKTVNDNSIEPISFIVPRKSELFQDDIYPDAPSNMPVLSSTEWFAGSQVAGPNLVSMRDLYEGNEPLIISEKEKPQRVRENKVTQSTQQEARTANSPKAEKALLKATPKASSPAEPTDNAMKLSSKVETLLKKVKQEDNGHETEFCKENFESEWNDVKSRTTSTRPKSSIEPDKGVKALKITESEIYSSKLSGETKKNDSEAVGVVAQSVTLRETVDRLATLVLNLEAQVTRLTSLNDAKANEIIQLEKRIRKLEERSK